MSLPFRKIALCCALWSSFNGPLAQADVSLQGDAAEAVHSPDSEINFNDAIPELTGLDLEAEPPVTLLTEDQEAASQTVMALMGEAGSWVAAPLEMLDNMRGAFDSAAGMRISLGIERAVYLNGALVASSSLNLGDLAQFGGEQAYPASAAGEALTVLQVGPGNQFGLSDAAHFKAASIIQNTLNHQHIAMVTTINAATEGLQVLKGLNLGAALRDALNLPFKNQ